MREILFRGKRIDNGEWVEGEMLHDMQDRPYIYWKTPKELPIVFSNHAIVDPATLGQFTGLTDKNGKKIFEGDIVKHYCEHRADGIISIGVVFWDENHCMFLRTSMCGSETPQIWKNCEYEVIGNIHDNPELLEGGAKDGKND